MDLISGRQLYIVLLYVGFSSFLTCKPNLTRNLNFTDVPYTKGLGFAIPAVGLLAWTKLLIQPEWLVSWTAKSCRTPQLSAKMIS